MNKPDHAHRITDDEWAAMDEKTQAYLAARARPGQWKTVDIPGGKLKMRAGWCPCDCHTWTWECEEANCYCGPCHYTCS